MMNDLTQAEKRSIIRSQREERKQPQTMHSRAIVEMGQELGGRFAALGRNQQIVGSQPISYPKLPANSPWASPLPSEEPLSDQSECGNVLGYSIDQTCAAEQSEPCQPSEDQHQDGPSLVDAGPQPSLPRVLVERSPYNAAPSAPTLPAASSSVGRVILSNPSKFRRRV
jgi:hypothetical protein